MNLQIALKADAEPEVMPIERFEALFGITYLPRLTFADWRTEQWVRAKCARAHRRGKIGELELWLGKLHGKQLDQESIPEMAIRWMRPEIGYGLFTLKGLKKWDFVGSYTGLLRRRNLFFPNINDYCFMYPREWLPLRAYTIDSEKHGNYTRFINHSDTPNCESVSVYHDGVFHILFRAIEPIEPGSQLTYDYGDIYWRRRTKRDPK